MNDLLYTGPNLLKDLTSLIIRAMLAIFMLLADISKFFQRIAMSSEDAHYQRFIALRMGEEGKVKKVPSLFSSLSFGLNASPFIATQILRTHVSKWLNDDDPIKRETAKQIHESSYCDDVILTTDNEEDLISMTQAMIDMLQEARLPVGKFHSNSTTTVQHFPDRCKEQKDRTSLLGCVWQPVPDTFTFNHITTPEPKAKRPSTMEEVESYIGTRVRRVRWTPPKNSKSGFPPPLKGLRTHQGCAGGVLTPPLQKSKP